MEARAGRHVEMRVAVMDAMQPPQPGDGVARPVPPILEQVDRDGTNDQQRRPFQLEAREPARRGGADAGHGAQQPCADHEVGDQHDQKQHAEIA